VQWNAIDCQPSNADWCCAVGEADSDSPVAGARIHCTQDGGASWNRTFFMPASASSGYSLMEIKYATDNDVWAVGGELGEFSPSTGTTCCCFTPSTAAAASISPLRLLACLLDRCCLLACLTAVACFTADPGAWFLYSGDGGLTWNHGTPPLANYYAIGLSFVDPTHAFAAMLDVSTQESAIAAYD
jgi:hypothetical protein